MRHGHSPSGGIVRVRPRSEAGCRRSGPSPRRRSTWWRSGAAGSRSVAPHRRRTPRARSSTQAASRSRGSPLTARAQSAPWRSVGVSSTVPSKTESGRTLPYVPLLGSQGHGWEEARSRRPRLGREGPRRTPGAPARPPRGGPGDDRGSRADPDDGRAAHDPGPVVVSAFGLRPLRVAWTDTCHRRSRRSVPEAGAPADRPEVGRKGESKVPHGWVRHVPRQPTCATRSADRVRQTVLANPPRRVGVVMAGRASVPQSRRSVEGRIVQAPPRTGADHQPDPSDTTRTERPRSNVGRGPPGGGEGGHREPDRSAVDHPD